MSGTDVFGMRSTRIAVVVVAIMAYCWCAAGFSLNDGTFLRDAKFQGVNHRGLVFAHSEGVSTVKPDELRPEDRERFADDIKAYENARKEYREKRRARMRAIAESKKNMAARFEAEKQALQKRFNADLAKVLKLRSEIRYTEALKLIREYQNFKMGKHLDYTAAEKIVQNHKAAYIKNPGLKDTRKLAYIMLLRVYIFQKVMERDASLDSYEIEDLRIKVETMQDKLWRLIRSLDIHDLVICADFFSKKTTFVVSPKGPPTPSPDEGDKLYNSGLWDTVSVIRFAFDPPCKKLWEGLPNYFESESRSDSASGEGMVNVYFCYGYGTDLNEFVKYVLPADQSVKLGAHATRYLTYEQTQLNDLLKQYYLTVEDISNAEVDRHKVLTSCCNVFLKRQLRLKCSDCKGTTMVAWTRGLEGILPASPRKCKTCSGYGVMLWRDYIFKTDK